MSGVLIALALIFTELSLLAFGGGMTILPEMQRQVVEVHQWMSARFFGRQVRAVFHRHAAGDGRLAAL